MHDYHVHSNYSDGSFLFRMCRAAETAGLDGLGFADHCNVSARDSQRREKQLFGFNLDTTYGRRREAIADIADSFDLQVYDAVEMDYLPEEETRIVDFLADAEFDYAIGSVHTIDDQNVQSDSLFDETTTADRQRIADDYFDTLVSLVDSELFDIAAHVDLLERNEHLRGFATDDHYERVATAFTDSRTVPEINAGRVLGDYGEFHPAPRFFEVLREYDVRFTLGTDSHRPHEIGERADELTILCEETGLEPVELGV